MDHTSRWFGNVVAVNDVTMKIGPGVTGLLGPNGAGKSTLINMMGGFLAPSTGTVTLDGAPIWQNEQVYKQIGVVPEREAMYDFLTGRVFGGANAQTHRRGAPAAPRARAARAPPPGGAPPGPPPARGAGGGAVVVCCVPRVTRRRPGA
ncbi:ATP-binding cassette domain-containing protein, partial [Streptomyces sp. NPDC059558]|uniref:ATP-binding cassette domain-containing protein n=1 Tax=Streptomyces sp. NPDC059558 TaxID=3346864 RepID=UPI00367FC378